MKGPEAIMQVLPNPQNGTRQRRAEKMLAHFAPEVIEKVVAFHSSIDGYAPTPLVNLQGQARRLGVKGIYVKDESYRFGLNSFKALGGSYAIASFLSARLGKDISELPYSTMVSDEVKAILGDVTFVTATDGNHGRGVAWTANKLRQKCVVHMPKGTAPERLANIQGLGAQADITDLKYDDAVLLASEEAKKYGWVLVQDTSWPGYEGIPISIMQGYTTLPHEAFRQMEVGGLALPTHVFVQAGVGSFAAAVVACFVTFFQRLGKPMPIVVVVEPDQAACIFDTLRSTDGHLHPVTGDMTTIMAGLACGVPATVAIDILANYAHYIVSEPDFVAAQGMRVLSSPVRYAAESPLVGAASAGILGTGGKSEDTRIISGESGASTFGFVHEVCSNPEFAQFRELLGIDETSVLFCISTEGDTDKDGYDRVVNNGAFPRQRAHPVLVGRVVSACLGGIGGVDGKAEEGGGLDARQLTTTQPGAQRGHHTASNLPHGTLVSDWQS